ncbi:MAG TPA: hypothetical protein DCQ68_18915 [Chryseobacterium indologenes]|nr:hypothetical protein [Chryseobacterium indologenes]
MFIPIQILGGSKAFINVNNIISISQEVNGGSLIKFIDGSEIKTRDTHESILKQLTTLPR